PRPAQLQPDTAAEDEPAPTERQLAARQHPPREPQLLLVEAVGPLGVACAEEQNREVEPPGERVEQRNPVRRRDLGEQREAGHPTRRAVAIRNHPNRPTRSRRSESGTSGATWRRARAGSGTASPICPVTVVLTSSNHGESSTARLRRVKWRA